MLAADGALYALGCVGVEALVKHMEAIKKAPNRWQAEHAAGIRRLQGGLAESPVPLQAPGLSPTEPDVHWPESKALVKPILTWPFPPA